MKQKPTKKVAPVKPLQADSPEARAFLDRIAPAMPTPQSPWDAIKRSPVHKLPVLCNGEASAERGADGLPVDGTGAICQHYWAFRRIPEIQNSEGVKLGERCRYCTKWQSADGPMEFGEGREHMQNICTAYAPASPRVGWNAALEQAPPLPSDVVDDIEIAPAVFDPGPVPATAYEATRINGKKPEQLTFEKDSQDSRWVIHTGNRDLPFLLIHFRIAFLSPEGDGRRGGSGGLDEIAVDQRYPRTDVRRYDKDRLFALEQCLERFPLSPVDLEPFEGARPWVPQLNKFHAVTIADVLSAGDSDERPPP